MIVDEMLLRVGATLALFEAMGAVVFAVLIVLTLFQQFFLFGGAFR